MSPSRSIRIPKILRLDMYLIWLVTTRVPGNVSAILIRVCINLFNRCCLSESDALPKNSALIMCHCGVNYD